MAHWMNSVKNDFDYPSAQLKKTFRKTESTSWFQKLPEIQEEF